MGKDLARQDLPLLVLAPSQLEGEERLLPNVDGHSQALDINDYVSDRQ